MMTIDQGIVISVLIGCFALFIWGRWRFDIIGVVAMLVLVITNIVPASDAFQGFGHPAVILVAVVLVISRALRNSGIITVVASHMGRFSGNTISHVTSLTLLVTVCSAFMNNVGALALVLPVALATAEKHNRSPAILLMPIAFGSIFGGLITLFGTPPNVIIASYRETITGHSFEIFDYAPVGLVLAVIGVAFVSLVGWRLIPRERENSAFPEKMFEIREYVFEVKITDKSPLIGERIGHVEAFNHEEMLPVGLVRGEQKMAQPSKWRRLQEDDILIVKTDPTNLKTLLADYGLEVVPDVELGWAELQSDEVQLIEVLVTMESPIVSRGIQYLRRRSSGNINIIGLARQGRKIFTRLKSMRFKVGDVILLQGSADVLNEVLQNLSLLPLAEREIDLNHKKQILPALCIFIGAILLSVFKVVSLPVAFISAIGLYVLLDILPARDIYKDINWPVIVMLASMMSIGFAMEETDTTLLIANAILDLTVGMPSYVIIALVLVVTMTLSDIINNAATAVIMAPIVVSIANQLNVSPDPFLMAVAVGASCAFLTPIGHQSNTLVMGPGGYHFGDYWRMGLPLEIIIVVVAVPMILWVWPL